MALSEKKLIEILQNDLRNLSNETKRKYQPVKEAAESAVMKIKTNAILKNIDQYGDNEKNKVKNELKSFCADLLQPFLMGCDTKNSSIIQICLTSIQRLINYGIIDPDTAINVIHRLWQIYDQDLEELWLRLLQTVLIILTSNEAMVSGKYLSHAMVLCFRLHFTKNEVVNNTAEATIRQVVALVFERVVAEDKQNEVPDCLKDIYIPKSGADKFSVPPNLTQKVVDAYQLFQDLCQLVNADAPHWLNGITEMTRTFGLELLENVLNTYQSIFNKHPEFRFLLKDKVCALVICLFSPNIKHRQGAPPPLTGGAVMVQDKPYFPISMRLLRVVSTLLTLYYDCLITESEIFLSLLIKFLETDKPEWQRALAVEVLQQLCIQPKLLRTFCFAYDMQQHSTKIYKNLVNALGLFIQNMFVSESANTISTADNASQSSLNNSTCSFEYKGTIIPVIPVETHRGGIKYFYREMLDKVDPPGVPSGYVLGMAFNSFLDLIRGLTSMIDDDLADIKSKQKCNEEVSKHQKDLKVIYDEMLVATWSTMLSVLALLLESSTDESTTASILKCLESCAAVCGVLTLKTARDAFITVLCKSALPVQYTLPIFNATLACLPQKISISLDQQQILNSSLQQQIVATGQALNMSNGSVILTAKNIQCMRTVISLSHCHGAVMNTAWQIILTTLQHLVWILGLKPTAEGKLKLNKSSGSDVSLTSVITNAVMTDLPELATTLSTLFESSKHLDDVELHHLINALCSLSLEAMDKAYNTSVKEPSLFAVAKLLETGLINMYRIDILWRPVSGHLLEVCQHPNAMLRKWGSEGVTTLVKEVLNFNHKVSLVKNPRMLHMFLMPLKEMSEVQHDDVQQKQLDSTLQILHNSGDLLKFGWPELLYIVGAATNSQSENIIRSGFRCLQLIVTDFLQFLSMSSLKSCIDVVTRFGKQNTDLNISLTAIGLLWSVSDFMFHNWQKIESDYKEKEIGDNLDENQEDEDLYSLWLLLFSKVGELCIDSRPSVRKSAGQTLFSTISTHGSVLDNTAWSKVIWDVLFLLMDNVQHACNTASTEKDVGNILIHHSRDTAEKQWRETLVLTLAGLSRVFKLKHGMLSTLTTFYDAWEKLFQYLEVAAVCPSAEVSAAAMFSFEDVLLAKVDDSVQDEIKLWTKAWNTWYSIGTKVTIPPPDSINDIENVISQAYITSFLQLFPIIHKHIAAKFTVDSFKKLSEVMDGALKIPIRSDSEAFIFPLRKKFGLTPLQEAIVKAIDIVQKGISIQSGNEMYPEIFSYLLHNVEYSITPPKYGNITGNKMNKNGKAKWICVNCLSFAEYCIGLTVELYKKTACDKDVIKQNVITAIIHTLAQPLSWRYASEDVKTWEYAIEAFMLVLSTGMPVVRQHSESGVFVGLWDVLQSSIDTFLFPTNKIPTTLSVEEQKRQEDLDLKVIEMIETEILPYSANMPKDFIAKIVAILSKGNDSADSYVGPIDNQRRRDRLTKACFTTLIQFSQGKVSINGETTIASSNTSSDINTLTIQSLIQQCSKLLRQYIQEFKRSKNYPLQEEKVQAVLSSLEATDNLFQRILRNKNKIESHIWQEVIDLYPLLVESITSSSTELRVIVAKILLHYKPLITVKT